MFCGNCGNKASESNSFCTMCGQAQPAASGVASVGEDAPEELAKLVHQPIAVKSVQVVEPEDQNAGARVLGAHPGQRPAYCSHSPSERTKLGVDNQDGSETCLGCKLTYFPGSPNSRFSATGQSRPLTPQHTGFPQPVANQQVSPDQGFFIANQLAQGRNEVDIMREIAVADAQEITRLKAESIVKTTKSKKDLDTIRWALGVIGFLSLFGMILNSNLGR